MKEIKTGILKGTPWIAPFLSPLELVSMGNTSKCSYTIETEKKELPDFQNPGGGMDDEFERLTSAKIAMSLRHISVKNLSLALGANAVIVDAKAVTAELHTVKQGCLVVFNGIQDLSEALTVAEKGGGSPYEEGTDYIRNRAGIIPLEGGTMLNDAEIEVAYKSLAHAEMQPLVDLTREYHVFFDGVNERTNSPVQADWYRVKFGPAKNIEFIGDDFVSLDIEGTLLKDETKTGVGASQYLNLKLAG